MGAINNRNFGLDVVRVTAISLVLLAHFVKSIEFVGFWGVELFFALSGYLIGQIIYRGMILPEKLNLKMVVNFWQRRWYRTLPNYYLVLVFMFLFHFFITNDFPGFHSVVSYFWFGQYFISKTNGFYGVSWSLCIEEWFYFIFPLLLIFFYRIRFKGRIALLMSVSLLVLLSLLVRLYMANQAPPVHLRGITLARLDAISFGVLMSFLVQESKSFRKLKIIAFALGLVMLIACMGYLHFSGISYSIAKHNPLLLLFAPCCCALILPMISDMSLSRFCSRFVIKVITNLSLWSYSLYLVHIPVLVTVYHLLDFMRITALGNLISKCIGMILTIIISAFIYKMWEVPLTKKRPAELRPV